MRVTISMRNWTRQRGHHFVMTEMRTTMNTAGFAGRGSGLTMIAPHGTGHEWAKNSTLLRVDCERGIGWVATHYDRNLRVIEQVGVQTRKYTAQRHGGPLSSSRRGRPRLRRARLQVP